MSKAENPVPERLQKLELLKANGINPYPNTFHRTHTSAEAVDLFIKHEGNTEYLNSTVIILAGRITAMRVMGKLTFVDIRDMSGKIQLNFSQNQLGEEKYNLIRCFDIGDFIGASGTLFRTKTGEITLKVNDFTFLAKSLHALPEKWHGLVDVEKRYRQRYLDLISNEETKSLFIQRSRIIRAIRRYLDEQGYIEVETPVFQPLAGGALARPFITHHHALNEDLFMRIALELYLKRLIVGGLDKVYEIGKVFRNEGISTRHNPEFTMLESYAAYADYNDIMNLVENMVSSVAMSVMGTMEIENNGVKIDLRPPWRRLSLREALIKKCQIDFLEFKDAQSLGNKMRELGMEVDPAKDKGRLIDDLISEYLEPDLIQPTFLIDYPIEMSPLAKNKPGSDGIVERFEGYIAGMEIANAFSELNDPFEQRRRFSEQVVARQGLQDENDLREVIDEDFILALEYGMPPTGGLGIGIDRLVMVLTGKNSIREVILFPQLKTK